MDFLIDSDDCDAPVFINIPKKYTKKAISDICCEKKMTIMLENGIQQYICDKCGKIIKTQENNEISEELNNLDIKIPEYGNKSDKKYKITIKNVLLSDISKVSEKYLITQEQIYKILGDFLMIRGKQIPRAKPRIGLICACIYEETKIPINQLSNIFSINQKYITYGIKTYARELLPFNDITIRGYVNIIFEQIKKLNLNTSLIDRILSHQEIVYDLVEFSILFYIGDGITIKTKVAGIFLYIGIDEKTIITLLDIGKNTIYKFYDLLIVYSNAKSRIDGLYAENFKNRYNQLNEYLKFRKIEIIKFPESGRFLKYKKKYIF